MCGKFRDFAPTAGFHHPCGAKTDVSRDVKCDNVKSRGGQGGEGGSCLCVLARFVGSAGRCAACGPQINALTTLSPGLNAPSVCLHGEGETEWKDLRGVL